jgi:hypothetical protein
MRFGQETPKIGSGRCRQVFALFPQQMSNGVWIWLEYYTLTEAFLDLVRGRRWVVDRRVAND